MPASKAAARGARPWMSDVAVATAHAPLAARMRPRELAEFIGQEHLVGPDGALRRMIDSGRLSSILLWGGPGTGKTTLAKLLAGAVDVPLEELSATTSGV